MNNLKEFKQHIIDYESIELADIEESESYQESMSGKKEVWFSEEVMNELTGYGKINTCTLCTTIGMESDDPNKDNCSECIWVKFTGDICFEGKNAITYIAFSELHVDSEDRLVEACHNRAEYMRDVIGWFDKEIK